VGYIGVLVLVQVGDAVKEVGGVAVDTAQALQLGACQAADFLLCLFELGLEVVDLNDGVLAAKGNGRKLQVAFRDTRKLKLDVLKLVEGVLELLVCLRDLNVTDVGELVEAGNVGANVFRALKHDRKVAQY